MTNDDWILFAKIAQYNSFSEAARRLSIPTTTVSRRIQKLESQLGERLFIRNTRSVTLTELGNRLLPKTIFLERALKDLHSTIENNVIDTSGKLKLATSDTLSQFLLPNLLTCFTKQYPLIEFDILTSNRNVKMINESIDFSFRIGELDDSNLIAYKLCELEYSIVTSPLYLKNTNLEVNTETLIEHPCIIICVDGKEFSWLKVDGDMIIELNINKKFRVDDLYTAKSLAELGNGIVLLPNFLIKDAIDMNKLVTLFDNVKIQKKSFNLIYFDKDYLSDKSKLFLEYIKDRRTHINRILNPIIK